MSAQRALARVAIFAERRPQYAKVCQPLVDVPDVLSQDVVHTLARTSAATMASADELLDLSEAEAERLRLLDEPYSGQHIDSIAPQIPGRARGRWQQSHAFVVADGFDGDARLFRDFPDPIRLFQITHHFPCDDRASCGSC